MMYIYTQNRGNDGSIRERRLLCAFENRGPDPARQEAAKLNGMTENDQAKFDALYARIDSVDRDVTKRALAGDEEGEIQLHKIEHVIQAMYDMKMGDQRFAESEQIQLTWIRGMNARLVQKGEPYRFGINAGRVQVTPLLRTFVPSKRRGNPNGFESDDAVIARMDAGTNGQGIQGGNFIDAAPLNGRVDQTFTPEKQEETKRNVDATLAEAAKEKDPSTMNARELDKLIGKTMMTTGTDITYDAKNKKFNVTPPTNAIERMVNTLNGAIKYATALIGKKQYAAAGETPDPEIEPEMKREDREKEIHALLDGKTDAQKDEIVEAFKKQMIEAAEELEKDPTNEALKKKVANLKQDVEIAGEIISGKKPGAAAGEKPADASGEKPGATPGDKPSATPGEKPVEAVDVKIPDWVPGDAAEAFRNPDTWKMSPDGTANIRHGDAIYRHSYQGRCEVYDANGMAQLEGKYFDKETNTVKDIPKNGVFDMDLQQWVILSPEEEVSRMAALAEPIQKAMNMLEMLENSEVSNVQNYEKLVAEQNWFQGFTNWLTDFKPYDMQLQNARMKLAQIRNTKNLFNERFANAESFREMADASNSMFKSIGMAEITDSMIALAPESAGLASIDMSYLDIAAQNEANMIVARDVIIDSALTVGTLGAGAVANLGRKGAMMAGRQVLGTVARKVAIRQGALAGATLAAGSSTVKNTDDVSSGRKTVGEAVKGVAVDTTVGAAFGGAIGGLTPSLQNGFRRIFSKVEERAVAAAADDAARLANGAKPAPSQLGDDIAKAAKEAEELARKEAETLAKAAQAARDAEAKAAKEAADALKAKAAKEAQDAAAAKAKEAAAKAAKEAEEAAAKTAREAKEAADKASKAKGAKKEQPKQKPEQPKNDASKAANAAAEKIGPMDDLLREYGKINGNDKVKLATSAKKIFDLPDNFNEDMLKTAYRKLAIKYQPRTIEDGKGVKGELMKQVNAAKDVLEKWIQPAKRAA